MTGEGAQPPGEQVRDGEPPAEQSTAERATDGPAPDQAPREQTTDGPAPADEPRGEQTTDDSAATDQPRGDQPPTEGVRRAEQTRDDTDVGWGEVPEPPDAHDLWLLEQRPPHWD